MWQRYVAKWSAKTPEVPMVTYQFTPCGQKQQNILLFHGVDIASVLAETPPNTEKRKNRSY